MSHAHERRVRPGGATRQTAAQNTLVFIAMQRRGELPSITEKTGNAKQPQPGGRKKPGGGKVASSSKHLATQLLEAVRLEKPRIVKRLLDNKISCSVTNEYGESPLHLACSAAGEETRGKMASQLLSYGCDVNAVDRDGRTALMRAVERGDGDLVRLLLENQSDAGVEDSQGDTVLVYAARGGKADIVRRLVREARRSKRDIDHKNMRGLTALLVAAREGHVDASRILAEDGNASLTVRDLDNFMTAEEWLLDAGYSEDEASFLSPKTRRRHRRGVKTLSEYIAEEKETHTNGGVGKSGPIPSVLGERGRIGTLHFTSQSYPSEQQRKSSSMFDFPPAGGAMRKKSSSSQNLFSLNQSRARGSDIPTHKHGLFNSPYLARKNSFVSPNRTSQYFTEGALEPISTTSEKHQLSASFSARPTIQRTHSIDEGTHAQSEFSQHPSLPPLRSNQQHK